jgi:hypothetical protein
MEIVESSSDLELKGAVSQPLTSKTNIPGNINRLKRKKNTVNSVTRSNPIISENDSE